MENIFKRLDFVIAECDRTTKHFDKRERDEIMLFCMCMLDRLNFASEGLRILMNNFLENTKVEYSCGLIIRSVLLDYLTVLNAMDVYGRNIKDTQAWHTEMKAFCLMMLSDSVKNTLEYFETMKNIVPKDSLDRMYSNIVAMHPECFEPYGNDGSVPVLRTDKHRTPKALFHTLVNSKQLKAYASVYDAYIYYSKYDHFGQMFYTLSRARSIDKLAHLDQVLKVFPRSLMFTLTILVTVNARDPFLKDQLDKVTGFIDEMEGLPQWKMAAKPA